jgi:hypothetical protein
LQRLRARTREQTEKFARFRGVLAVGLSRIRTGDGGFRVRMTPQPVYFSVAMLSGSDSLSIRPSQRKNFRDPSREFEFSAVIFPPVFGLARRMTQWSRLKTASEENFSVTDFVSQGAYAADI